ncbi:FAD-dependent oxidoreductase [Lentzea sp. NBRC 105346]|uniref:FAD-dependent oxidoreductase n=1 Tax=Lentzea sp. NBRC 105346 TaxID=3032205 RepID=UPI0024A2BB24|nr:FAD-dependent oxidoreductase [Lentzea sp. NBRC 105346]GLZ28041.1 FAD-dependent oxidoreductase [Lentzea sp. NBRC 105346]
MRTVIVGAGIAGVSLAWWLERAGWDVLVLEQAPAFREGGYMIDFFGPGYRVADRMGLLDELKRLRAPISSVTYVDHEGRRRSELDESSYDMIADDVISLPRGDLARTVYEHLRSQVRFGVTVDQIEEIGGGVRVTLTDGSVEHADLLVGADGVHSRVRELVFGREERFVRYLGYHTAAFTTDNAELSARIGPRYQMLTVPGRMMGCYAMRDSVLAALFLYRSNEWDLPRDAGAALREEFAGFGWVTPEVLRALPDDLYFDQVCQVELDSWHEGRVVLLGDSCQAVSLFAGHGASLAVTAAFVLAEELQADAEVETALGRYQDRMRPVATKTQEFGRRFIEWMAPSTRWRILARDMFLKLARVPVIKGMLRKSVSPDTGDVLVRPGVSPVR